MKKILLSLICAMSIVGCSTTGGNSPKTNTNDVYNEIIQSHPTTQEDGVGNAYTFYDINGDGQDELIIADAILTDEGEIEEIYTIVAIYTVKDGKVEQIVDGWSRNRYTLCENGYLVNESSNSASEYDISVYKMEEDGSLVKEEIDPMTLKPVDLEYTLF